VRPGGEEPRPPAAGGAMARRAPCGGWDSALPEESRPSNRLAVRQVTGHCRPFGGQVFLIASTRCRFTRVSSGGFRDGETGRHVGCVHGRHGGGRHAWPVDRPRGCTGGSHGNRWTFGKEPERQRAGGRFWFSPSPFLAPPPPPHATPQHWSTTPLDSSATTIQDPDDLLSATVCE